VTVPVPTRRRFTRNRPQSTSRPAGEAARRPAEGERRAACSRGRAEAAAVSATGWTLVEREGCVARWTLAWAARTAREEGAPAASAPRPARAVDVPLGPAAVSQAPPSRFLRDPRGRRSRRVPCSSGSPRSRCPAPMCSPAARERADRRFRLEAARELEKGLGGRRLHEHERSDERQHRRPQHAAQRGVPIALLRGPGEGHSMGSFRK
jgi:hypothetical protein